MEKTNETMSWFFKKVNKTDKQAKKKSGDGITSFEEMKNYKY